MTAEERFQVESDVAEMTRSLPLSRDDLTPEHHPTLRILWRLFDRLGQDAARTRDWDSILVWDRVGYVVSRIWCERYSLVKFQYETCAVAEDPVTRKIALTDVVDD